MGIGNFVKKNGINGALAGAALMAFGQAADARCTAELTAVTTGGYTVTYDVHVTRHSDIANEIEARLNANGAFRTATHPAGYVTDINPNGTVSVPSTRESRTRRFNEFRFNQLIRDHRAGGNDLYNIVRELCAEARDAIRVPTTRQEVRREPAPQQTRQPAPARAPAPAPARAPASAPEPYVSPYAPEASLRPEARPEICEAADVQPIMVIEVPCDCEDAHRLAANLNDAYEERLGIDVIIDEEDAFVIEDGINLRISIQNTGETFTTELDNDNSRLFRLTEDGDLLNPNDPTLSMVDYTIARLQAMEYAPVMQAQDPAPEADDAPIQSAAVTRPQRAMCPAS